MSNLTKFFLITIISCTAFGFFTEVFLSYKAWEITPRLILSASTFVFSMSMWAYERRLVVLNNIIRVMGETK